MRLQEKLTLYNAATKIALIFILGTIILFSLEKISINHLDNRLSKKETKLIRNLNDSEVDSLLNAEQTFTDYNILKDEFIVLTLIPKQKKLDTTEKFSTGDREIMGDIEAYRILTKQFEYKNKYYQLELGTTAAGAISIKKSLGIYMFIVLMVSLSITLVTDYAFTRFLLKPFYKILDQKINKVNDPITFDYSKIPTNTTDFVLLDDSINGLMRKITDLFLLEKQFIANVSHELLTPISILNGRLENILASETLAVEHEEKIMASLKTLSRLKSIINSLLLISKVENEQYVKKDQIVIRQELEDIYEDLTERISDKRITYENQTQEDFIFLGNQPLIHTLLINIINNAIKYSKNAGKIVISDQLTEVAYTLSITDNGIGMENEIVKKAFHRFERENNEEVSGLGLGLAICNSIAKFHHISLDISSKKNEGTKVSITFPLEKQL
ncbi:ATP-binding protein [Pedobacter chitinilyticus]|uniref:histidine kinase n=1 Tax=Pedobacter chitinilyticus TaxID=2233776 RepID=A0A3S3QEC0_9SPHI|nr:HAMP domain-containing sensor histidine kinase [Pedobacter chitinilyticus]RWU04986.1 HAMP domain-containing histidine kinase [Pedobacter chitinilyticus]